MTVILVTGATGKTSLATIEVLKEIYPSFEVVCASRGGKDVQGFPGVKLDWSDPSTYENPWGMKATIDRLHIVAPLGVPDLLAAVKPFVEFAIGKGVKRFTFISGTAVHKGDPFHGLVHQWLSELPNIEYAIIRPSWFFQNFSNEYRLSLLRDENKIVSNAEDGLAGWLDTRDIGEVVAKALTEDTARNGDYIVVGPETLTYDQIAEKFTEGLGRKVTHVRVSGEEFTSLLLGRGLTQDLAVVAPLVDGVIAAGLDQSKIEGQEKTVGKRSFEEYIQKNKALW
ncbi:hypothetical protein DL96DRAFT_1498503, partial [Flagelloscypha sp. PMI_526]